MTSVCGMKRCTGELSPSIGKRHCDYQPCPEYTKAHQMEPQPDKTNGTKLCTQDNTEQAMEVETLPQKTRVFTSMPGNNSHGPRYISAPYVTNCSACINGASGHINHGSYFTES